MVQTDVKKAGHIGAYIPRVWPAFFMPLTAKSKKGIVEEEMHNFKNQDLHSGKNGPVVKNKAQAVAIALSEARRKGYK